MKKIIGIVNLFIMILLLGACYTEPTYTDKTPTDAEESNILIAYFSWADNVYEFNPDELEVDSYTGASLFVPGNGEVVANFIYDEIGGTLHKIIVRDLYSPVYDECLDRARTELRSDSRPELQSSVENFDQYKYIFLGFPNWWNQAPRAILTFLDSYNFEGKTVIMFCMHGTNGETNPVAEVARYLPSSTTVMTPIGVYRPNTLQSRSRVVEWLNALEFNFNETED